MDDMVYNINTYSECNALSGSVNVSITKNVDPNKVQHQRKENITPFVLVNTVD